MSAAEGLAAEIASGGPMLFSRWIELALYGPDGFYATEGRAGRRAGDFITSPEVGPLFGAVIAQWLDEQWHSVGNPTPFRVSEAGAGVGALYRAVRRADPECGEALRYTLVERSAAQRGAHESLPAGDWVSAEALPPGQHVVLANELLDNMAFDIAERTSEGWRLLLVDHENGRFTFVATETDHDLGSLDDLCPGAAISTRVPLCSHANQWVTAARENAQRILLIDYGASTAELGERDSLGFVRTYRDHHRGSDPFDAPGSRDITGDVAFDQLPTPSRSWSQADFLREYGLDALVDEGRRVWEERGHIGDLAAIEGRSRVTEAAALTDPSGLGGFTVLEW